MDNKNVIVLAADGCEEIECLTCVDILRRAKMQVDIAGINSDKTIHGAHGINFESDTLLQNADVSSYDCVILPGGAPGYKNLESSKEVKEFVLSANDKGLLVAAICAAPTVLGAFGLLHNKKACCYPGMEDGLIGAFPQNDSVVKDKNIITSRGVGTAISFALAIVEYFYDKDTAINLGRTFVWEE